MVKKKKKKKLKSKQNSEIYDFCEFFLGFTPHLYQKNFLDKCIAERRLASKWCRQSGK